MSERRRLTIEELETMPVELWRLEVFQIGVDAGAAGLPMIESDAADLALSDDLSPAKILEIRGRLLAQTGAEDWPEFVEPEKGGDQATSH